MCKYGNPHNTSFLTVMCQMHPVFFGDEAVFFHFDREGNAYLHTSLKRLSEKKLNAAIAWLSQYGRRKLRVYVDENDVINRCCQYWGAGFKGQYYEMEI